MEEVVGMSVTLVGGIAMEIKSIEKKSLTHQLNLLIDNVITFVLL